MAIWSNEQERREVASRRSYITNTDGTLLEDGYLRTADGRIIKESEQESINLKVHEGNEEKVEASTEDVALSTDNPITLENTGSDDGSGISLPDPDMAGYASKLTSINNYDIEKTSTNFEGDYSDEFLSQSVKPLQPEIFSPLEDYKATVKRAKSNKSATWEEKYDAFVANAGEDNLAANIASYITEKLYTDFEDEGLRPEDTRVYADMKNYNLEIGAFGALKDAKSEEEYTYRLAVEQRVIETKKQVSNALTDKQIMTSSITGMVGDLDILGGVILGSPTVLSKIAKLSRLDKSSHLMQIAAIEGTYETSLALARTQFNDDFGLKEGAMDVAFGMGASIGLTHLFNKSYGARGFNDESYIPDYIKNQPLQIEYKGSPQVLIENKQQFFMNAKKPDTDIPEPEFNAEFKAMQRKQSDIQNRIREAEKNFDKEVEGTKEHKKALDNIQELRTAEAQYRNRQRELEAGRNKQAELEYEEKVTQAKYEANLEAERTARNAELAEQFKHPKYEIYNQNRKEFFKKQKKINSDRMGIAVRAIDLQIKNIKTKLSKVRKELDKLVKDGGTDRKINNRKKKIQEAQAEIDKLKADRIKAKDTTDYTKEDELYTMRIVDDMMENVLDHIDTVKTQLKLVSNEALTDIKKVIDELYSRRPDISQEIHNLLKSKLGNKSFKPKGFKADDMISGGKLNKKQKAAILALASGTVLSADSGNEDHSTAIVTGLMILLVGYSAKDALKSAFRDTEFDGIVGRMADRLKDDFRKSEVRTSDEGMWVNRTSRYIADKGWSSLTSAIAPFVEAGGKTKEFVETLFFSHRGGDGLEMLKGAWNQSDMSKYDIAENKHFSDWLKEKKLDKGWNRTETEAKDMFRQELNNNMRMRDSKSKSIQDMTKELDSVYQRIWDRVKEYGVKGFENLNYIAGKTARIWDRGTLHRILTSTDDEGIEKIREGFYKAIVAANGGDGKKAWSTADALIKHFKTTEHISEQRQGSLFEMVEDLLKDDVDLDDFIEATTTTADLSGRAKKRIPFDVDSFPEITIRINGKTETINKSMLVENDAKKLLDSVMAEMNSLSALSKGGFPSVKSVRDHINNEIPSELQEDLHKLVDGFLHMTPEAMKTGTYGNIMRSAKDIAISEKLWFVMFSVPYEILKTIANGGLSKSLKNIGRMLHRDALDQERLEALMDLTGSGTHFNRYDKHGYMGSTTEGIEGFGDAGNQFSKFSHKMMSNSMVMNGLTGFTDWVQRANLLRNEDKLAEFITNKTGMTEARAKTFGVDSDFVSEYSDAFKFNANGSLKPVDMTGWSMTKRDNYALALKKMGQDQVLEHTIGESPMWGSRDMLGKILSTLLGYPIMMHNNHFLKGMEVLDKEFLLDNAFAFSGSYAGLQAKYSLLEKDVEDEQIVMYALMNTLPMAAIGSITSLGDPAVLQVVNTALNLVNPVEVQKRIDD